MPSPSASSARMRAACASARRSSRPLAIASDWLWSVIAMYSRPASRAAAAIVRDVVLAVGLGGVHVQVAAQIGALDQARQRVRCGRLDLAAHLAQLRRNPRRGRAPRRCPPRVSPATRASSAIRNSPYSFSLKPRPIARSRSAMLCAFEPVKYCIAAPRLSAATSRRSAWKPPLEQDARLGVAVAEHALDQRVVDEVVHQRRPARRRRAGRGRRRSRSRAAGCRPARSSAPGARSRRYADERGGGVVRVATAGGGRRSACAPRAPSGSALPSSRPSLAARGCGRRRRRARGRRACGCRARDTASRRSSARRPAGAAGRGSSAGTRRPARGGYAASPVSAISRIRAARSLPMPGNLAQAGLVERASSCGWLAAMSAPLRYARILNGLSSLISSRSAISRRMRAIAALSKPQAFGLDAVVEQARAAGGERRGDRRARARAGRSRTGSRRRRRRRPWPRSRRPPARARSGRRSSAS